MACGPERGHPASRLEWEIYNLHISPARQGGGIGSRLFDAAAELGRKDGARELVLWVVETNGRARAFYEAKSMYADGGEQQHLLGEEILHEVRYRKDLDATRA